MYPSTPIFLEGVGGWLYRNSQIFNTSIIRNPPTLYVRIIQVFPKVHKFVVHKFVVHKFVNFGEISDDLAGIELANRFTFSYLQRLQPARSYKNFYNLTGAERYN